MGKDNAINITNNYNLNEKSGFSTVYKNNDKIYYQKNREVILNKAKYYYENKRELLREQARNKYKELSEEEIDIKRKYGRNRYHNMSEKRKIKRISKRLLRSL